MSLKTLSLLVFLSIASFAAQASGKHASGHAHDGPSIGEPGLADKVSRTVTIDM
jgi:hypothetical protein